MTTREAQKQLTRARLVEAAVTAFHHQGYAGTTVEDIAAAAGVTRATFYLHYEGKVDIYRQLERGVRDDIDDLHVRMVDVVGIGRRAGIRAWLDEAFDLWHKIKEFATIQEQVASLHTEVRHGMTA